ncbi:MAG: 2-oxo acid dehydrogenase subunit E2 [Rubripirellula sp.]|nr:2-oxo acid dehydrogenase subunit E2 [Rubripirellula sp.]
MTIEVKLPDLGDGIESGDVLEIFVAVGDTIDKGQDIVEMETDKATVTVPASAGGKVTKILISEGDTVAINGAILELDADAAGVDAATSPAPETAAAPEPAPSPEPDPPPAAPAPAAETPPVTPQPVSPQPTPVAAAPTTPVVAASQTPVAAAPPSPAAQPASESTDSDQVIAAGPAIRRFAREVGVDLSRVPGSGDGGRITRDDILSVVRASNQSSTAAPTPPSATKSAAPTPPTGSEAASANKPAPNGSDEHGPIRVERMDRIRKTIANQMHASWSAVPRVTNFDDADITDLEHLRQSSKEDYAAQGLKLTTMPFLIKAIATALRHHPAINAVIDQENDQIIYKDYVNVGIAVDTDRGLVVPVMKNADMMGIPEITRSLAEMAGKVRGGNFAVSDLRGGSFTISNLGAIGGQYSTPIVNVPEVAILLVGRSRKLPVVMPDDSIQPRLMMPLSLSYDHRLVDGGTAARFLNDVIGFLEAPSRLLLAL